MISSVCKGIRWCPIIGKPPVPIPNTVVKTYRGENTWRATSWEDSTMPASNLRKRTDLMDFKLVLFLFMQNNTNFFRNSKSLYCCKPPFLSENVTFSHLFFGRVIPNTVVKTCRGECLVARIKRVFGFCIKELTFFLQKSSALCSQSAILGGPLPGKIARCQHLI